MMDLTLYLCKKKKHNNYTVGGKNGCGTGGNNIKTIGSLQVGDVYRIMCIILFQTL